MTLAVPSATGFVALAVNGIVRQFPPARWPSPLPGRRRPCLGQVCAASARARRAIYGDTVTWRNSRPWALSTPRSPGRAITNRAARRAQPAKAPSVGELLQPRPLLWLLRTHCGLGRISAMSPQEPEKRPRLEQLANTGSLRWLRPAGGAVGDRAPGTARRR